MENAPKGWSSAVHYIGGHLRIFTGSGVACAAVKQSQAFKEGLTCITSV